MESSPIAENIRRLRETRHWTQEELSLVSGVDVRTIQRAESGRPLAVASLKALAAAFDTTPDALSVSSEEMLQIAEHFQRNYSLIELQPFDRGTHLTSMVGTHAFQLERVGVLSDAQADAVADLEQALQDLDVWRDLGAIQRREMEKYFQEQIDRLTTLDVTVSFGLESVNLRPQTGGMSFGWTVLYVAVSPGKTALRCLARDKRRPFSLE